MSRKNLARTAVFCIFLVTVILLCALLSGCNRQFTLTVTNIIEGDVSQPDNHDYNVALAEKIKEVLDADNVTVESCKTFVREEHSNGT